ncbi:gfo/Idh/MocA family oxidoreductase [Verminephrobacter aporrectodeae subsp. tuberculatae]|uniref:Gfo/Idh/MocA family protein n=1 Tax=Verminephrobacter aporrectodeae TaxID=1110389 RepID=UPI002238CECB|nr:Gfo/Idh/MocA family oxidoreductase [Verminephrobacter aporrectodeae]MCW5221373.1 gfo/Idh/MocA family oxidoreductase [Verminephrobacter aporrectodeae subsp. tuberculatae]MCW5290664.1 gfo/Idh/MocA family oxidoreductase [Verminephrobacter aporrectodeae subsp. tuberculatae]
MTSFATLDDPSRAARLVLVGAGAMGANWASLILSTASAELVGAVDIVPGAAARLLAGLSRNTAMAAESLADLVGAGIAFDAIVNVTVPAAHHAVTTDALFRGKAVLSEKPLAPTVAQAISLAAAAAVTGRLLMVSQSRRYFRGLTSFKRTVKALGPVGLLTNDFFKAPHFGGFRETMAQPLLVDMGIHPFDAARFILDDEPVSVYCESFNPSWSWYAGDAAATALFTFSRGTRFRYTGSWCSPGDETSWNGAWRASSGQASVLWDGANPPVSTHADVAPLDPAEPEEIAAALAEFIRALRTGAEPSGIADRNLVSLAMVEAAVLSAQRGAAVRIADVLADARNAALGAESRAEVRAHLLAQQAGSGVG